MCLIGLQNISIREAESAMPVARTPIVKGRVDWIPGRELLVGGASIRNEVSVEDCEATDEEEQDENQSANHDRTHDIVVAL